MSPIDHTVDHTTVRAARATVPPEADRVPGVVTLPSVPDRLVRDARQAVTSWLSAGMPDAELDHLTHAERMARYRDVSAGDRALREGAALQELVDWCVPHVQACLGDDLVDLHPGAHGIQVGLRLPGESGVPHVDGIAFGADPADPQIPDAVLGVYLSDVGPDDGALAVWPGARADVAAYGREQLRDPGRDRDRRLYDGMVHDAVLASAPRRLVGPAGTTFLSHGALVHANATNAGTGVRYALFVRFFRSVHYPHGRPAQNHGAAWGVLTDTGEGWTHSPW